MPQSDQPSDHLEPGEVQSLSEIRSEPGPIFSLYLDLRGSADLLERFEKLLGEAARQNKMDQDLPENRQRWEQEAAALREGLRAHARERQSGGLAVFSSQAAGLWRAFRLPAPVADRLAAGERAFVRPLEVLLGESTGGQAVESAAREGELEAQRLAELTRRAENNQGAVLGLEQSLMAVRNRKARLLVVEEDFHEEGGECPNCGFLSSDEQGVCLLDGMALRPEPDIIEAALKRVLDQGGEIEILRSETARGRLAQFGRIGALVEVEGADTDEKEGKMRPEALHDEKVEESFPASDPPGGW